MKNIILCFFVCTLLLACKKNNEGISGTRDLKNLSLSELKNFLNGKWKWQYSIIFTIAGVDTIRSNQIGIESYIIFYPIDSIMQINQTNNIITRESLVYQYLGLPGTTGISSNVLMFAYDGYDYLNKWVADRLINDTLVFANYFRSEGVNNYYFTKVQ